MLNIGAGEVIFLLIGALLILGPKRLPELARGIGKFMREFRRQTDDVRSMVEREFYKMDNEISQPLLSDNTQNTQPKPPDGAISNGAIPPIPPVPGVAAASSVEEEPFPGFPDHTGEEPPPELPPPLEPEPPVAASESARTTRPVRSSDSHVPPTPPPEKV
ncbi:MAG: Sec-independent protein translocase subunit TatA/TatB [Myxococcaceae bacterium]